MTPGEMLSFIGLLLTTGAIVWRGGTLSSRLSNIEVDVAQLVTFQKESMNKFMLTAAETAKSDTAIADLKRRADAMERRCEECMRWRQKLDDLGKR